MSFVCNSAEVIKDEGLLEETVVTSFVTSCLALLLAPVLGAECWAPWTDPRGAAVLLDP